MINLLPDETKREIRAARRNILLRRYVVGLTMALLLLVGAFGVGYYVSINERWAAEEQLATTEQQSVAFAKINKEAKEFAENLTTAKSILSNQVTYSQLVTDIAKTLPKGAVLASLNISAQDFGKPVTITALTTNAGSVPLELKSSLQKSQLFENVSIISITEKEGAADSTNPILKSHHVSVSINATLASDAGKEVTP